MKTSVITITTAMVALMAIVATATAYGYTVSPATNPNATTIVIDENGTSHQQTPSNEMVTLPNQTMVPVYHYHFDIGGDGTGQGYLLDFNMLGSNPQ